MPRFKTAFRGVPNGEIYPIDYNPGDHCPTELAEAAKSLDALESDEVTRADLDAALAELPDDHTDPDYVVDGMRVHFGDLFTEADEAKVRELVKAKPSHGLTIPQIKKALAAREIAIPDGITLKADLAALLDTQPAE